MSTSQSWPVCGCHCWVDVLSLLRRCIDADESVLAGVSLSLLARMANNLVEVVAAVVDVSDYITEMKMSTVAPWLTLFSLIHLYVLLCCLVHSSVDAAQTPSLL